MFCIKILICKVASNVEVEHVIKWKYSSKVQIPQIR